MKKYITLIILIVATKLILAQVPQGIKYQAVIRDSNGEVLSEQNIALKISILQSSPSGSTVYSEEHAAQTNTHGLINLTIGEGTILSGDFSAIPWDNGPFFIKVELDPEGGINYTEMGTSQLLSVPYALYSGQSGEVAQYDSDTLFVVKDNDGNVVFAVFPDGAKVYVNEDNPKGPIGGFAVSGRNNTKGEYEVMRVTPDSTRIFVNQQTKGPIGGFAVSGRNNTKKSKGEFEVMRVTPDGTIIYVNDSSMQKGPIGGFAVSGRNNTKGDYEVMKVTPDSTRIYINQETKGPIGGFAVSGRNNTKNTGTVKKFMDMTKDNYFIGHESGSNNQTGKYNSFIGFRSGVNHAEGDYNVLIGYETGLNQEFGVGNTFVGSQSGRRMTSGEYNTYIGYKAGYNNLYAEANTFVGGLAGENNDDGSANTFVGLGTGRSNMTGSQNTFVGAYSGQDNTSGAWNTFLGEHSGVHNEDGNYNVYIGSDAGLKNTDGNENVFLGESSGLWNTGSNNVFIGHESGFWETSSNKFYITNSAGSDLLDGRNNALLFGDFANNYVIINSQLGVNVDPGSDALRVMGKTGLYGNTGINAPPKTDYSLYVEADSEYCLRTQGYNYLNGNVGVNHSPDSRYGMLVEGGSSSALYVIGDIITQSSNVGINHGAPTHPLHVNGTLRAANSTLSSRTLELNQLGSGDRSTYVDLTGDDTYSDYGLRLIRYGGANSNSMLKHKGTGSLYLITEDNGAIRFNTNGTNRIEIEPNGLVGIGHPSPSYKLHVLESSRTDNFAAMIQHNGGSYRYHGLRIAAGANGSSSSNTYMIDFRDGDFTNVGSITLRNGSIYYNTSSDRRLKTKICTAKINGLETIKNIPVVNFAFKESPKSLHTGFIAQDVQKVFPEAVSENEEGYLQLALPNLIPVLTKAIQEQDHKITKLEEENKELKETIKKIYKMLENK